MATGSSVPYRVVTALEALRSTGYTTYVHGSIACDPSLINTAAADSNLVLGGIYRCTRDGFLYRYVQFKDAVAYVAGHVVFPASAGCTTVTNDVSGGSSVASRPVGICLAVMTQNYYGFVLVYGNYATVKTNADDNVVAGDPQIMTAADGGVADSAADPNPAVYIGHATAADVDANDTVQTEIRLM